MTRHVNWRIFMSLIGATVVAGCNGSGPSGPTTAPEIVNDYLSARGADLSTLRVVRDEYSPQTGRTHVRMEQEVDGLRVVGAYIKATVDDQGLVVHAIDRLAQAPVGGLAAVTGGEQQALDAAVAWLGLDGNFAEAPSVDHIAYVDSSGTIRAGYLVETWSADNLLYETIVDAAGRVVATELRSNTDRYNVFLEDPDKGAQTIVSGPSGTTESPIGWLGAGEQRNIEISGNNTHAYLDALSNNQPDRGGVAVTSGDFLTVADLTVQPWMAGNSAVATQNLFYLNNRIHDTLYSHGFTEAAGNFQADNFGRGGLGSDPVQAEAQDGGGLDNANFATPPDGRPPRMQMYLWSGVGPDHFVDISAPTSVAGTYGAKGAIWGPALTTTGISGDIVLANDGSGITTDGCQAFQNAVAGKIALVDRGSCFFTVKARNAQAAGAIAIIVANNVGGDAIFTMGGTDPQVRIPGVMISEDDGARLKRAKGLVGTVRKSSVTLIRLDGDLDSDIVYHEYGHGLTWRMIGGMSGPMSGAIGEGASDSVAFLINGDDVVAEYASGDPDGIRRFHYDGYPLTYGDVTGAEVHNDGEIYAAIIWRLSELFGSARLGNSVLLDYFVDGMNYTPSGPAFEDMRDGILQSVAAHAAPSHACLVWEAFAEFGVGVGADGNVDRRGNVTITESFALPAECQ